MLIINNIKALYIVQFLHNSLIISIKFSKNAFFFKTAVTIVKPALQIPRYPIKNTILYLIPILTLTSCFNLREPATPITNGDFTPPTDPDVVLANLSKATATLNINNYQRCFSNERFHFKPEPTVSGNNVGIFSRWTLVEELDYLKNILNKSVQTSQNHLIFSNEVPGNVQTADSVQYSADYDLLVYHQDTTFKKYNFRGNVIFTLVRNRNNEWAITYWQDNKKGSDPCWTELKQYFIAP